VTVTG